MCGRYYRRSDKQRIADAFALGQLPEGFVLPEADYNVAPSTLQPVIRASRDTGERQLALMRWGVIPHFATSPAEFRGISTINARAESVQRAPLWRTSFRRRRCLVPADGFYEWKRLNAKVRQPFAFALRREQMLAFAGLWDAWKAPDGSWLQSFAIVTTGANELMASVHNRMPVILPRRDWSRWLDRDPDQPAPVDLLRPLDSDLMTSYPVDPRVGNVRVNEPGLCVAWECPPNSA